MDTNVFTVTVKWAVDVDEGEIVIRKELEGLINHDQKESVTVLHFPNVSKVDLKIKGISQDEFCYMNLIDMHRIGLAFDTDIVKLIF